MMLRARFEPIQTSVDYLLDDSDLDRTPPPPSKLPPSRRSVPNRFPKPVRHLPPALIGTRTLGRASYKQQHQQMTGKEFSITLRTRPGYFNVLDAFLIAREVVGDSASWNQGLRSQDLFIKFGSLTKDHFAACGSNLECLLPIVARSFDEPIECIIIRGQRLFDITLRGMRWPYGVCLGAVINAYPEPIAKSKRRSVIHKLPSPVIRCNPTQSYHVVAAPHRRISSALFNQALSDNTHKKIQGLDLALERALHLNPTTSILQIHSAAPAAYSNSKAPALYFNYSSPALHFNSATPALHFSSKSHSPHIHSTTSLSSS